MIDRHPFGIKIWKPALYKKHRSIEAVTWNDLHSIPGTLKNELSFGNLLWAFLFGWWIALVYIIVAILGLGPIYMIGLFLSKVHSSRNQTSILNNITRECLQLGEYISLLLNLADYILWPFAKFIAKKIEENGPGLDALNLPGASVPLLSSHDHDRSLFSSRDTSHNASSGRSISNPHSPLQDAYLFAERDNLPSSSRESSFHSDGMEPLISISRFNRMKSLLLRVWKAGPSRWIFFLCMILILGPIHMITSALMFFFVFPIPMGKLNYYLFRHILRHPLQLSAHWCDVSGNPPSPSNAAARVSIASRTSSHRPRSVFFFQPDTTVGAAASYTVLPTIMATPSVRPIAEGTDTDYQIVLCTYRAMGFEYARYTVDGINIILINLVSMIVFTIFDFYFLGPILNYTGIASKSVIFLCGVISTIPLSYFIGMAVSSITAHTGSVAIGSVVNATFGSIIEIILYAFGLMNGKEELVQGAMIGSFLLGLLALPGVAMFFGGLRRPEQRFNAKSASVTSTMLVVATICVFTPTIFQKIHGSYQFQCKTCPDDKKCNSCQITQPHPTDDPVYLSSTRPLMFLCAIVLVLTYAIGLLFTLRTHSHRIYGKKKSKKHRKRRINRTPSLHVDISDNIGTSTSSTRNSSIKRDKGKAPENLSAPLASPSLQKRRQERHDVVHHEVESVASSSISSDEDNNDDTHDSPGYA